VCTGCGVGTTGVGVEFDVAVTLEEAEELVSVTETSAVPVTFSPAPLAPAMAELSPTTPEALKSMVPV